MVAIKKLPSNESAAVAVNKLQTSVTSPIQQLSSKPAPQSAPATKPEKRKLSESEGESDSDSESESENEQQQSSTKAKISSILPVPLPKRMGLDHHHIESM